MMVKVQVVAGVGGGAGAWSWGLGRSRVQEEEEEANIRRPVYFVVCLLTPSTLSRVEFILKYHVTRFSHHYLSTSVCQGAAWVPVVVVARLSGIESCRVA